MFMIDKRKINRRGVDIFLSGSVGRSREPLFGLFGASMRAQSARQRTIDQSCGSRQRGQVPPPRLSSPGRRSAARRTVCRAEPSRAESVNTPGNAAVRAHTTLASYPCTPSLAPTDSLAYFASTNEGTPIRSSRVYVTVLDTVSPGPSPADDTC